MIVLPLVFTEQTTQNKVLGKLGQQGDNVGEAIALATDGVSDDLDATRLGALITWVIDELGPVEVPVAVA